MLSILSHGLRALSIGALIAGPTQAQTIFPGATWTTRSPAEVGMDPSRLDAIAAQLGGARLHRQGRLCRELDRPGLLQDL